MLKTVGVSSGRQGSVFSVWDHTMSDSVPAEPAQPATNRIIRPSTEDHRSQLHLLYLWLPTNQKTGRSVAALQGNQVLAHRPITADKRIAGESLPTWKIIIISRTNCFNHTTSATHLNRVSDTVR